MSDTPIIRARLSLHELQLMVHLGYGEEERAIKQPILVSIDLHFTHMPDAAAQDGYGFLCYDALSQTLKRAVAEKSFQLIEYLAPYLGNALEGWLNGALADAGLKRAYVTLRLHKPDAPVDGLLGGASFTYSTLPQGLGA